MTHSPGPWEWIDDPGDTQGWGHAGPTLVTVAGKWERCEYFCHWNPKDQESRGSQGTPGHEHFRRGATILTSIGHDADSVIVDNEADARLIAAAPRMLEALEYIMMTADVPHPLSGRSPTVAYESLVEARAAITEALGKQEAAQAESPGRSGEES